MPFVALGIDHVEVFVRDLEADVRWYGDVFGVVEVQRWNPEPVMVEIGGTRLAFFLATEGGRPDPASGAPHWHRVAFRTDEEGFGHAQRYLKSLGIPFRGPIDHDIARSIYFTDPDGNPLEITYYST